MLELFRKMTKREIQNQGRKQEWIVKQLGVSLTQLSRMLNGHSNGSFELWSRLFHVLGLNVKIAPTGRERRPSELWAEYRAIVYTLWDVEEITTSRAREMLGLKSIQEVRALFAEMDTAFEPGLPSKSDDK